MLYAGLSMVRKWTLARYSPNTPSVKSWAPAKIDIMEARNGKPGTTRHGVHRAPRAGNDLTPGSEEHMARQRNPCPNMNHRRANAPVRHCPNCGGELKIIAAILEQPVIERILTHLGLQARVPPRTPARAGSAKSVREHSQRTFQRQPCPAAR